jgi:hypothetical protein
MKRILIALVAFVLLLASASDSHAMGWKSHRPLVRLRSLPRKVAVAVLSRDGFHPMQRMFHGPLRRHNCRH